MLRTIVAKIVYYLGSVFADVFAAFFLAVKNSQRVLFVTLSANRAHFVQTGFKVFFKSLIEFRAAGLATDAVDVKFKSGYSHLFKEGFSRNYYFRVRGRSFGTEKFYAELVEFSQVFPPAVFRI